MITDTRIDPPSTFAPLEPDTPPDSDIRWTIHVAYAGQYCPEYEQFVRDTCRAIAPRGCDVTFQFDDVAVNSRSSLYTTGEWTAYEETFQAEHTPQFAYELGIRLGIEVRPLE